MTLCSYFVWFIFGVEEQHFARMGSWFRLLDLWQGKNRGSIIKLRRSSECSVRKASHEVAVVKELTADLISTTIEVLTQLLASASR